MSEIDFYTQYYAAVGKSRANAAYCERLYGKNLAQHGFAEVLRLEFEAEGNLFLYENHRDEAQGAMHAFAAGMHARYLYRIAQG